LHFLCKINSIIQRHERNHKGKVVIILSSWYLSKKPFQKIFICPSSFLWHFNYLSIALSFCSFPSIFYDIHILIHLMLLAFEYMATSLWGVNHSKCNLANVMWFFLDFFNGSCPFALLFTLLELVLDLLKPILLQKKIKLCTTFTISVWYKIIHKDLIDKKIDFFFETCKNCWELNSCLNHWVTITNSQHDTRWTLHAYSSNVEILKDNFEIYQTIFYKIKKINIQQRKVNC
jgi:hypothetical protein